MAPAGVFVGVGVNVGVTRGVSDTVIVGVTVGVGVTNLGLVDVGVTVTVGVGVGVTSGGQKILSSNLYAPAFKTLSILAIFAHKILLTLAIVPILRQFYPFL